MISPVLSLYMLATRLAGPFAERKLDRRLSIGKEDAARLPERLGAPGAARPDGPLVWFHAASVGESLAVLDLIRRVREGWPQLNVMITTGTVTSAEMMANRLPQGVIHQYAPLDVKSSVDRFLAHWSPDLVIWTESELWPRMLRTLSRRGVPLVLLNARMSARSFARWRWIRGTARRILCCFSDIMVQDQDTLTRLQRLGAPQERMVLTGTLKDSAAPLPHDEGTRKSYAQLLGGRPVWAAASTHPGEEKQVVLAHQAARRALPGLLLILVPRHPERGAELVREFRGQGWSVAHHSEGDRPGPETGILVADTLGELGLWYRLAPVSFVGGSLTENGGHNPYEPAALGSAIIHGPHVANFRDAYSALGRVDGAREVNNPDELSHVVTVLMQPDAAARMATAAWTIVSDGAGTLDAVLERMTPRLDALSK
ncbi:3-deoxy-D-manno-octulosonic acid transferase [Pontivivens insulae]|uniref:3-deoxy-D-manno-octulosonic acid transferase n=1 Tax=Pontivivens insulae TaxID=1639689 RepID=A0A2R8AF46_9RHOB|nr:3-deoxy-D-manno-octulosonic acid transferase [Pontivivens insulae]RED11939.1 3-deoxy-D-manno-octulosonic-acid transferase [Pontivivens insulae]SPF30695.1 3-deoxy-D-manno-octulosonic acid transferase [Pontivivens insulae]